MSDSAVSNSTLEPIVAVTARMTIKDDSALVGPSSDVSDRQSDVSGSQSLQPIGGPESDQCVANANVPSSKQTTKVYYNIDDETTPYCTEVPVPPDRITLRDFKNAFNRQQNFKYYCKRIDKELGKEVKSELRDDSQPIERSQNDIFELFLLTAEGSTHSDGSSGAHTRPSLRGTHMVPAPAPSGAHFDAYNAQYMHGRNFDPSLVSTDSESMFGSGLQYYPRGSMNRRPQYYPQVRNFFTHLRASWAKVQFCRRFAFDYYSSLKTKSILRTALGQIRFYAPSGEEGGPWWWFLGLHSEISAADKAFILEFEPSAYLSYYNGDRLSDRT
ncbi:hypothetical protein L596_002878 [Steinernema carpocapsae]|uniref:DIX domain-containing protein n=1 Tax=Steinernema carpocapsae TaxID=34508 RepID=A0A4U8UQR8_STECR|nr:hypothetical protein L596_002878 [Steinernema carpocapsae]